jgi:CRP-like cAMP-binding protein
MGGDFFEKFRRQFPFSAEKWDEYLVRYQRVEVPARTVLLREGEVSRKAWLIEKGIVRAWFSSKGRDITFQFFVEDMAVSSAESFRKKIPSVFTLETVEPCVLHCIHKKDMDQMMQDILQVPESRDRMIETLFERQVNYANHFLSFIKYTPQERYAQLLAERPDLILRVPQQYIASYLGVTPVSLSRIKSKLKR